jgi:hypothetical protein
MLFFFEAAFFLLAISGLVISEVWGRGQALVFWLAVSLASVAAAQVVAVRFVRRPSEDAAEARWRQTVVASWRHFNLLLGLGLVALGLWWLSRG